MRFATIRTFRSIGCALTTELARTPRCRGGRVGRILAASVEAAACSVYPKLARCGEWRGGGFWGGGRGLVGGGGPPPGGGGLGPGARAGGDALPPLPFTAPARGPCPSLHLP